MSHMFEVDEDSTLIHPSNWPLQLDSMSSFRNDIFRYIGVPGSENEWWNDPQCFIGYLSKATQDIKVVNTLTGSPSVLSVPQELTLDEICRFHVNPINRHVSAYKLKYLDRYLDLSKTLAENGISPDEADNLRALGIPPSEFIPSIYLYFIDDLTVG